MGTGGMVGAKQERTSQQARQLPVFGQKDALSAQASSLGPAVHIHGAPAPHSDDVLAHTAEEQLALHTKAHDTTLQYAVHTAGLKGVGAQPPAAAPAMQ